MQSILFRALAIAGVALPIAGAQAQAYPTKPVRIVVGFVPGGGSDFIARVVAQKLSEPLGRTVVVDNRPGAGGVIATEYVARQPADGYTLLLTSAGPNALLLPCRQKSTMTR